MAAQRPRTSHRIGGARETKPSAAAPIGGDGEVARRAYALFLARGGEHGHDMEDWLEAEREVNREARRETRRPS